jgi:hypothetical protein
LLAVRAKSTVGHAIISQNIQEVPMVYQDGDAPRDVIWREQKEEPNVVPPDRMDDLFFDDCPVCQAMRDDPGEWRSS